MYTSVIRSFQIGTTYKGQIVSWCKKSRIRLHLEKKSHYILLLMAHVPLSLSLDICSGYRLWCAVVPVRQRLRLYLNMCQSMSPHALTEESACTFFQSIVSDSDPQEEQNFFRHACVIHIYELFFNLKSDFDALQLRVIIFKDLIWPHRRYRG